MALQQILFAEGGPPPPPPKFVNAGAVSSASNSSSQTPALPASIVAGNLLLAYIEGSGTGTVNPWTCSAGWTVVHGSANKTNIWAYAWRIADGSDVAPTFTTTETIVKSISQVLQYSGTHQTSPIDTEATGGGGGVANTSLTYVTITTNFPNELVVAILIALSNQTIPTIGGYTIEGSANATSNGSSTVCDLVQATAGVVAGGTVGISSSIFVSFQIGLRTP
jgi:hypothetical protein